MMTKTLAKELAPDIRVCGVAPGSILWPENAAELNIEQKNKMLDKIEVPFIDNDLLYRGALYRQ
jgi:pteridine reductase